MTYPQNMDPKAIKYDTKRLDHLGIVAGICHEIELVDMIDSMLATPSGRQVSCGTATLAMILNGLGFTGRALYLMPEYLENKPVDLLIREDLVVSDFNNDTLGRALDELFQAGNGYAIHSTSSEYGGIKQRWLVVHSEQFEQLESKQLDKQVVRATMQVQKAVKKLKRQEFACEKDARQAMAKFEKKLKWHKMTAIPYPVKKHAQSG